MAAAEDEAGSCSSLTARLKAEGLRLGLDAVGVAAAVGAPTFPRFREWLARGDGGPPDGDLPYLHRHEQARAHPSSIVDGARSVVMGVQSYHDPGSCSEITEIKPDHENTTGRVAKYARGGDYHELFWGRLGALLGWLKREAPGVNGRAVSDSAPLLERDFARMAGLGWVGKNTMLIDRRRGSFTVIGGLLVDVELEPDAPYEADFCGSCTRCLDACPTGALPEPGRLDATRCISTWTIERRGPLSDEEAANLNGWVFGCDICQDVCPWNRKATPATEPWLAARDGWANPDLIAWLEEDEASSRKRLKGTAMARAKRAGLVRNAAAVLGSRGVLAARPALVRLRENDRDPVVRDAAARALRMIDERAAGAIRPFGPSPRLERPASRGASPPDRGA
jgi:epoxyqueuosine reductase